MMSEKLKWREKERYHCCERQVAAPSVQCVRRLAHEGLTELHKPNDGTSAEWMAPSKKNKKEIASESKS